MSDFLQDNENRFGQAKKDFQNMTEHKENKEPLPCSKEAIAQAQKDDQMDEQQQQADNYKADQESKAHEHDTAVRFLGSMRGRYIMAQALHYAIEALDSVEGVHKEVSNLDDMRYIRDELFNFPIEIAQKQ